MQLNLTGKRAIVCGSTQGIGKATAIALANEGVSVTLIARNEQKLKKVCQELPGAHGTHLYIVADFSNPAQLKSQLQAYFSIHPPIHILVNNTGGPPGGAITSALPVDFEAAFRQHLICNHYLAQAVLPGMKHYHYGRIINVISTSVKQPLDGLGVSNTIRAAVANWAKTLANEVAKEGITVNNILPGATETGRLKSIIASKAEKSGLSPLEITQKMQENIPARRFGKPDEIAAAITFLASEAAAYINGVNLPVDGGRTKSL